MHWISFVRVPLQKWLAWIALRRQRPHRAPDEDRDQQRFYDQSNVPVPQEDHPLSAESESDEDQETPDTSDQQDGEEELPIITEAHERQEDHPLSASEQGTDDEQDQQAPLPTIPVGNEESEHDEKSQGSQDDISDEFKPENGHQSI